MRTLITNGTVVNAGGSYAADVLIDGETIAAIGAPGSLDPGGLSGGIASALTGSGIDRRIDAAGKYVIAVNEDIDPDNADALLWAMSYRANPAAASAGASTSSTSSPDTACEVLTTVARSSWSTDAPIVAPACNASRGPARCGCASSSCRTLPCCSLRVMRRSRERFAARRRSCSRRRRSNVVSCSKATSNWEML